MGTSATDSEEANNDIYVLLGLKKLQKEILVVPRVLSLISALLERSVQKNETLLQNAKIKDVVTLFHGLRAPSLSIPNYIDRIFKYAGCSPSCFVVAQIYIDRFLDSTKVNLTSLNVHRLLITSIMLAAKFNDDAFYNNAYYAKVGGVSTAELNRLEMEFLFSIDFRLHISVDAFRKNCYQLVKEAAESQQLERPIQACGIGETWSSKEDPKRASTIAG